MPCYLEDNVDRQRGKGVFEKSIRGLQRLNALGYGRAGSGLVLNLVYNPQGPSLPPPQEALEADYRRVLGERYGIVFNHLFTLANMPIKRFGSMLAIKGELDRYLGVLRGAHADANLDHVMCRNLISVDWRASSTTATSTRCSTCRSPMADGRASTSPTCSTPISPTTRSGSPAIATAAPPGKDRAAAARLAAAE